jgi:hypothetical protein
LLIGEFLDDALVFNHRLIGLAEFAVAFAKAKDGGGGELAVFVEGAGERFIFGVGGGVVAFGLF